MVEHPDVKEFVQCTLGCGCPEEVFENIEREPGAVVGDGIRLREKIKVGDRLLIYLVDIDDPDMFRNTVPVLLETGRAERDLAGFNRFRLVVAAIDLETLKTAGGDIFKNSRYVDEKVHLHLVSGDDLEKLK